ncbi:NETI motif-containing protein [Peribacillus loiseleuriae]|uniref:NETI motif-containing protein n=1 Tax=Peribacillus loiseleuriae TaxID=1679170 RepID=UPI003CFD01FB
MSKKKKEVFEVEEGESIDVCLERIKAAGYTPIKRIEKPIFAEEKEKGETIYKPVSRKIVFEALLNE